MEYIRKQLLGANNHQDHHINEEEGGFGERAIIVRPGQIEKTTRGISFPGRISLEELRFSAFDGSEPIKPTPNPHRKDAVSADDPTTLAIDQPQQPQHAKDDSYIDIAVFEIPKRCSSRMSHHLPPCDLSSYGIGKHLDDDSAKNAIFPSLCDETTGRLVVNSTRFQGYKTEVYLGRMDRINDPLSKMIPTFPSDDSVYEVWIANCNPARTVAVSGKVVVAPDPWFVRHQQQQSLLDAASQLKLLLMGVSICVLFSLFSFRIHNGTRADYFWARRNRTNRVLLRNYDIDAYDNVDDDDDDSSPEIDEYNDEELNNDEESNHSEMLL